MRRAALMLMCAFAGLAATGNSSSQQKARNDAQVPEVRHAVEFAGIGRTQVHAATETSFTFGAGSAPFLLDWIRDFVNATPSRRSGYVFSISPRDEPTSQTFFSRAAVAEVALPALDVTSRDPLLVTLRFRAEKLEPQPLAGTVPLPRRDYDGATRKWPASGFRLRIDGVEATRVTRVEELVFRQSPTTAPILPKLVVTLAESDAGALSQWHDAIVGKRQNGGPRIATLELLGADRGRPYMTLRFDGVVITKMESVGVAPARRVRAEMTLAKAQLSFAK
jgi:hypothetical protein